MIPMNIFVDGDEETIDITQFISHFGHLPVQQPDETIVRSRIPANTGCFVTLECKMDKETKKIEETRILPMPQFLVNNPHITITPARSIQGPSTSPTAVSNFNRMSNVSSPVAVQSCDNINNQEHASTKNVDIIGIRNNSKRISSTPISSRPSKVPRLSITNRKRNVKEKLVQANSLNLPELNQVKNHIKKSDPSSKLNKVDKSTFSSSTSSSSSTNKVPLESSAQSTSKQLSVVNSSNCKGDHINIDVEEDQWENMKKNYVLTSAGKFSCSLTNKSDVRRDVLKLDFFDECYQISNTSTINDIINAFRISVKQIMAPDDYEQLKLTSRVVKSPERDSSSETQEVCSTSSKSSSYNNNSTSKIQSTSQVSSRSQRMTLSQSSLSKQTIQISTSTKHHATSSNMSSKLQQSNFKQNDSKEVHVSSSNQLTNSVKHPMATVSQIPLVSKANISHQQQSSQPFSKAIVSNQSQQTSSVNKQSISNVQQTLPVNKQTVNSQLQSLSVNKPSASNQSQLSSSKQPLIVSVTQLPSVTKQLVSQSSGGKTSSIQDVKKCSKCKTITDDDVCTTCRMSSQLKGVTVTRIETPSSQPLHVKTPDDNTVIQLSSDDDEVSTKNTKNCYEPPVYKTESTEQIKKHIEKLSLNPKLLEDKLWQKDLSTKDYFKFESCRSVQIGSFNTLPVSSGDLLICTHGIRMTVRDADHNSVTIDVQIENIKIIMAYYGEDTTTLLIYTTYLAGVGIQHLLKMKENNKKYFFNPVSNDKVLRKIIWTIDLKKSEVEKLEKFLVNKFKEKYASLTTKKFNEILSTNNEVDDKKNRVDGNKNDNDPENIIIYSHKMDDRNIPHIKICDYRMLQVEEFINDIIIEFYLSWWYTRKLSVEDKNRSYLFNSFFYTSLTSISSISTTETRAKFRHERVKKWTKNVNVFEKDFIFIPINEAYHWFMVVICFPYLTGPVNFHDGTSVRITEEKRDRPKHAPCDSVNVACDEADGNTENLWDFEVPYSSSSRQYSNYEIDVENLKNEKRTPIKQPCILVFDSLNGGLARARIVATLREWLHEEYKIKHNGAERDFSPASVKGSIVKVPQQPNSVDCGLFVFHYFEKFFERPIVDYHCPILHLENWFPILEITRNCQKRRDVQQIILQVIDEQGGLPPNVVLPHLNFVQPPNSLQHFRTPQNHYNQNNQPFYNNHESSNSDNDVDDVDDEEEYQDDEDNTHYFNTFGYDDRYEEEEEEEEEYGNAQDPSEYYSENQWPPRGNAEYNSDLENELSNYRCGNDNNVVVDVDELPVNNHNYRNLNRHYHTDVIDEVDEELEGDEDQDENMDDDNLDEDEEEPNNDNLNRARNHSKKHCFNQHGLSN